MATLYIRDIFFFAQDQQRRRARGQVAKNLWCTAHGQRPTGCVAQMSVVDVKSWFVLGVLRRLPVNSCPDASMPPCPPCRTGNRSSSWLLCLAHAPILTSSSGTRPFLQDGSMKRSTAATVLPTAHRRHCAMLKDPFPRAMTGLIHPKNAWLAIDTGFLGLWLLMHCRAR